MSLLNTTEGTCALSCFEVHPQAAGTLRCDRRGGQRCGCSGRRRRCSRGRGRRLCRWLRRGSKCRRLCDRLQRFTAERSLRVDAPSAEG